MRATWRAAMWAVLQTLQLSSGLFGWAWAAETDAADTQSRAVIAKITAAVRNVRKVLNSTPHIPTDNITKAWAGASCIVAVYHTMPISMV
jgi:DNA-binding transcriptional regulator PaaX